MGVVAAVSAHLGLAWDGIGMVSQSAAQNGETTLPTEPEVQPFIEKPGGHQSSPVAPIIASTLTIVPPALAA